MIFWPLSDQKSDGHFKLQIVSIQWLKSPVSCNNNQSCPLLWRQDFPFLPQEDRGWREGEGMW